MQQLTRFESELSLVPFNSVVGEKMDSVLFEHSEEHPTSVVAVNRLKLLSNALSLAWPRIDLREVGQYSKGVLKQVFLVGRATADRLLQKFAMMLA